MNSTSISFNFKNETLDKLREVCYDLSRQSNKGLQLIVNVIDNDKKQDFTVSFSFKLK